MERTTSNKIYSALLKRNKVFYYLNNVSCIKNSVYGIL